MTRRPCLVYLPWQSARGGQVQRGNLLRGSLPKRNRFLWPAKIAGARNDFAVPSRSYSILAVRARHGARNASFSTLISTRGAATDSSAAWALVEEPFPPLHPKGWGTRPSTRSLNALASVLLRPLLLFHKALNVSDIFFNWFCNRIFVYVSVNAVRRLKPSQQLLSPFAGIARTTANSQVIFFPKRPLITEVFYSCSGRAPRTRRLFH